MAAYLGIVLPLLLSATCLALLIRSFFRGDEATVQWVVFTEQNQNDGTIPQDHVADIAVACNRGLIGIEIMELTEDAGYEPEPVRRHSNVPTSLLAGQNGIAAALGFGGTIALKNRVVFLVFPIWIPLIVCIAAALCWIRLRHRQRRVRRAGFPITV